MAKRKKKTSKRRATRRRRVSGVGKIDINQMAIVVGGAVAANMITSALAKSGNSTFQKAAPFAGIAAGVVLPMVMKTPLAANLSLGLIAGGGVAALGPNGLKVIGYMNNMVAYPGGYQGLPYQKQVAGLAPASRGTRRGTHSNFSGSRQSQLSTIAGFNLGSGEANAME